MGREWIISLQVLFLSGIIVGVEGLPVVEGQWGNWSEWSSCTRTCGGGVSVQNRTCLSGMCSGAERQYQSCCVQPCPAETPDFRAVQCSSYNNLGASRQTYNWRPFEEARDQCQLTCVSDTEALRLVAEVIEGTSCRTRESASGVCLGRLCARVGCDGILGSWKVENKCLQCVEPSQGNTNCIEYSGVYTSNVPLVGYAEVLTLPAGATSIKITHTVKPQNGPLALRSPSEHYYFARGAPGLQYTVAGSQFSYSLKQADSYPVESLTATGPLLEDVTVELYVLDAAPTVEYEYYLRQALGNSSRGGHRETNFTHSPEVYSEEEEDGVEYVWMYGPFSECSVTCGLGVCTAYAHCRDVVFGRDLPNEFCTSRDMTRPLPIQRKCSRPRCPPRWQAGEWSTCSMTCDRGVQVRSVTCEQVWEDGMEHTLPDVFCEQLPKPRSRRECNERPCQLEWRVGEWDECSVQCGLGTQERTVMCVDTTGMAYPPHYCSPIPPPPSIQPCNSQPCCNSPLCSVSCNWTASRWTKCSNSCGRGTQTRRIRCRTNTGRRTNATCCADIPHPEDERECYGVRRCTPDWHTSNWGSCNATGECGSEGMRHREVTCVAVKERLLVEFPHEFCNATTRPEDTSSCVSPDCQSRWVSGPYGECSVTCGGGLQNRTVRCEVNGHPATGCNRRTKPTEYRVCGQGPCPTSSPPCVDSDLVDCDLIEHMNFCNDYFMNFCCACRT